MTASPAIPNPPADHGVAATRWVATGSLLALIVLCLAWELWLAPVGVPLALAIPMCILYELGIWAAQIFIKHTKAPEEAEESASAS